MIIRSSSTGSNFFASVKTFDTNIDNIGNSVLIVSVSMYAKLTLQPGMNCFRLFQISVSETGSCSRVVVQLELRCLIQSCVQTFDNIMSGVYKQSMTDVLTFWGRFQNQTQLRS